MKPIGIDDVRLDQFWTHPDGGVWRIESYCELPTVTFVRVDDTVDAVPPNARVGGAVGSPIVAGFRRLVPETDA